MARINLRRALLNRAPEKVRHFLMRQLVALDSNWPSPLLEIKIAITEEELESAYKILHDSYVASGFMNPDPTGLRVLPQHLLPQTTTIVAKWDSKVIGTLSLIRDNPLGLPLEKIFDVSKRRIGGRRLAEVSSLAIDPNYRGQINVSLFPLFRFVYQYAKDYFGTHEFVIAVNPSMVDLYKAFMCFEDLESTSKAYDFVNGAPAVGLYLDFEAVKNKWIKVFNTRPKPRNFYKYWTTAPSDARNQMPQRLYFSSGDPILTPDILEKFFIKKANISSKLSLVDIQLLMNTYPFPEFENIFKPLLQRQLRKEVRFETQMKGVIDETQEEVEILNVSRFGLLIRCKSSWVKAGDLITLHIWLNQWDLTKLRVRSCWSPQSGLLGCEIMETSDDWIKMIVNINLEFQRRSNVEVKVS